MTFSRSAATPNEYRRLLRNAEGLGFKPSTVTLHGDWETSDGDALFLESFFDAEVHKVGWKYFHLTIDGEVRPCKPTDNGMNGAGYLRIEFKQAEQAIQGESSA